MFWDEIKEIKQMLKEMKKDYYYQQSKPNEIRKLDGVITEEHKEEIAHLENLEQSLEEIKESIGDIFSHDNEGSILQRLDDKVNMILMDERRNEEVNLARKTLDKFEDYMKNVDKLNMMVNEIKGLVAVSRTCLNEKKELETLLQDIRVIADRDKAINEEIKKNCEYALFLHNQQFKIDALYEVLITSNVIKKKEPKKRKTKPKEV
jgi:hypothetical protein